MTSNLMPNLATVAKIHDAFLDGDDLVLLCATPTEERAELRMPLGEALKLNEWLSNLLNVLSGKR